MQKILTTFFSLLSISLFSQEYLNKTEKYDLELFKYLDRITVENKIPIETYLNNSKPFSKWDIRPIKYEKIWALDSIRTSSEISNFFWGGFSQRYKLTEKEAGNKPNQFLKKGQIDKKEHEEFLKNNIKKFNSLALLIIKNKHQIFLNQISLQRVDNIYKENGKYWSYVIPKNSPFPISTKVKNENKFKYESEQVKILELLLELKIYAAVHTKTGIFFLLDGFTDNSYGYYYTLNRKIENENHLFEIMFSEQIDDAFYYYIAN